MTVNRMSKTSLAAPTKFRNFRAGNVEVTGGNLSEDATYYYRTFTSSGTLNIIGGNLPSVEYIVIAGGGGAGNGGGGAGGYRASFTGYLSGGGYPAESKLNLSLGNYAVVVGAGGNGSSAGANTGQTQGSISSFAGITTVGGGYYWIQNTPYGGGTGGSGGGAGGGAFMTGGPGTTAQGFKGGDAGAAYPNDWSSGGGGAGGVGGNGSSGAGGNGGPGLTTLISGISTALAGGGAGGGRNSQGTATAGGGNAASNNGSAGTANTGGGGGGGGSTGGAGGSGVVIIRYPKSSITSTFADYELIGTVNVGSTVSSVVFGGIPQQYSHLQLRLSIRTDRSASATADIFMRFNSDATASYSYHQFYGYNNTASSGSTTSTTGGAYLGSTAGSSAPTSAFGSFVVDITDANSITKNKTVRTSNGTIGTSSTTGIIGVNTSLWMNSTTGINTLSLYCSTGNILSGTRISLYGIRS